MEVCPYCKKPFKRLKSHLPHCKRKPTGPADHGACQSKLAAGPHATDRKRPITDSHNTKERGLESKSEKRNTKSVKDKPERTTKTFPLLAVGLEKASNTKADEDLKNQVQCSLKMLKDAEPKIALQGETQARFYASENTAPKKELARDLPPSGESRSQLSESEASLPLGPVEPSSSNQDRKRSSALPNDVQTTSLNLRLDEIDPPRQKRPGKLPATANGDYRSPPTNAHHGVESVRVSLSSHETESKARDHLSEVSGDVRDPEIQEKSMESQFLDFKVSPSGEIRVRENQGEGLDLGVEARGRAGNAERSVSVTDAQDGASVSCDAKDFRGDDSATEEKRRDKGPDLNLFTPRETTCSELLSVSRSQNQNLASMAVRLFQEEKAEALGPRQVPDVKGLMERAERAPPQASPPGCQRPLRSVLHCASEGPFRPVGVAGRKGLSSSLGLEWFPELYPGYLGLGVLPGTPQYWNAVAQQPQFLGPQGERLSQGKHAGFRGPAGPSKQRCALIGCRTLLLALSQLIFTLAVQRSRLNHGSENTRSCSRSSQSRWFTAPLPLHPELKVGLGQAGW